MAPTSPQQFKVVIVGDSAVGKTCLLHLFTHDTCKRHLDRYIPTTGVDFYPKVFEVDGAQYNFHFCDVAGNSRKISDKNAPPYYKGAHGVIVVFDVTNAESFNSVTGKWLKDVRKFTDKNRIQVVIVGNKCDSIERIIDAEAVKDLADDEDFPCFEASASTESNVRESFVSIAKSIRREFDPREGEKPIKKSKACVIL